MEKNNGLCSHCIHAHKLAFYIQLLIDELDSFVPTRENIWFSLADTSQDYFSYRPKTVP